jgi:hypothetical protein
MEIAALIGPSANRRHEANGHLDPAPTPGAPAETP